MYLRSDIGAKTFHSELLKIDFDSGLPAGYELERYRHHHDGAPATVTFSVGGES